MPSAVGTPSLRSRPRVLLHRRRRLVGARRSVAVSTAVTATSQRKDIVTAEDVGVSCGGAAQVTLCARRVCPPRVVPQTRRRGAAVVFLGFYQPFKMLIVVDNFMYSCGQFTSQIKRYCNVASYKLVDVWYLLVMFVLI